jgi:hypothetical protein
MFHFKMFITLSIAVFFLSGCTEKQATSEDKAVGQLLAIYGPQQSSGVDAYLFSADDKAKADMIENTMRATAINHYLGLAKSIRSPSDIRGRVTVTQFNFQPNCHRNDLMCIHVKVKNFDNATLKSNDGYVLLVTAYAPESMVLSVYEVPFDLISPLAFGEEGQQLRSLPKNIVGNPKERLWNAYLIHQDDAFAHSTPKRYISLRSLKKALPQFDNTVQILDIAKDGVSGTTINLSTTAVREQIEFFNGITAKYNDEKKLATVIALRTWDRDALNDLKDVEGIYQTDFTIRGNIWIKHEVTSLENILRTIDHGHTMMTVLNDNSLFSPPLMVN